MAAKKKPAKKTKKKAPVAVPPANVGGDRAAAIRTAAFHAFAEAGYHATSVDDICAKAGVSKGTFYWYFETKEQIFVEILEVWADEVEAEVTAQFRAAFDDKTDPMRALLVALGREGRRGRKILPVWLDALVQSQRHPGLRKAIAHFLHRVRGALTQVVAPTFGGFYAGKELETIAGLLLSSFIGSISQEMAEPDNHIYDEQSRTLLVTVEHYGRLLSQEKT